MADQAADQQHKRSRKDKTDESADSSCGEVNTRKRNTRKRNIRKRNTRKRLTRAELLGLEEPNNTPFDPVAFDKSDIEKHLRSGFSILILGGSQTNRGYCRALSCLERELTRIPSIGSNYCLKLIDLTGKRFQPNHYYHVTCMEHIFDLTALLEQKRIKMKGGISVMGRTTFRTPRFHPMIEDWFANSGQSADIEGYDLWSKAYNDWKGECTARERERRLGIFREDECTYGPIPKEPAVSDYFSAERTPRLLSEVIASVEKMHQTEFLRKAYLEKSLYKNRHDHPADPSQRGSCVYSEDASNRTFTRSTFGPRSKSIKIIPLTMHDKRFSWHTINFE